MQQQHHYQQQHHQHPDLDPTSSRLKAKEEADRGVDKITSFPIDGECRRFIPLCNFYRPL